MHCQCSRVCEIVKHPVNSLAVFVALSLAVLVHALTARAVLSHCRAVGAACATQVGVWKGGQRQHGTGPAALPVDQLQKSAWSAEQKPLHDALSQATRTLPRQQSLLETAVVQSY